MQLCHGGRFAQDPRKCSVEYEIVWLSSSRASCKQQYQQRPSNQPVLKRKPALHKWYQNLSPTILFHPTWLFMEHGCVIFIFFPEMFFFPCCFCSSFWASLFFKKNKKQNNLFLKVLLLVLVTIKEMCEFPTVGHSLELIVKQLWCTLSITICYVTLPQSVLESDKTEEILTLGLG